jgi:hypothetical protein
VIVLMRALLVGCLVVASSCGPAAAPGNSSREGHALYHYLIDTPTRPLTAGDRIQLSWKPRLAASDASEVTDVVLCAALFGPFESADVLKKAMDGLSPKASCPMTGSAVATEPLRTPSNSDKSVATEITVPSRPGFYDFRQVAVTGTSAMSGAGIIEVRPR